MPKRTQAPDPTAIAGISAAAVRGFLLQAAEVELWTPDYAAKTLAVDKATAQQVIEALQVIGYVEPIPGRRSAYRTTEAGNAVAGVSKAKPILRKTLQRSLDEFVGRVAQVNEDPHYLYAVERAVVFGPYITTNAERLKNVDVAVKLVPKEPDPQSHEELTRQRAEEAASRGKRFPSFAVRQRYAEDEVRAFLKARSRGIALYDLDEKIEAGEKRVMA
jgi:hypothetical protein